MVEAILWTTSTLCFWAWYRRMSESAARREWTAYHNWVRKGGRD